LRPSLREAKRSSGGVVPQPAEEIGSSRLAFAADDCQPFGRAS
jgi:hypothetical protein